MTALPPDDLLPPRGATMHRDTGRVLPVDPDGAVLLIHGWDPDRPDEPFWASVGGAVEAGESVADAAARELAEEVGIVVAAADLGSPFADREIRFDWAGRHIVQRQRTFAVAVGAVVVSLDGLDEWEQATTDGYRWWLPDELAASDERTSEGVVELVAEAARLVRSGRAR